LCQLLIGALIDGSHQKLVLHILAKPGLRVLCMPAGVVTGMLDEATMRCGQQESG